MCYMSLNIETSSVFQAMVEVHTAAADTLVVRHWARLRASYLISPTGGGYGQGGGGYGQGGGGYGAGQGIPNLSRTARSVLTKLHLLGGYNQGGYGGQGYSAGY